MSKRSFRAPRVAALLALLLALGVPVLARTSKSQEGYLEVLERREFRPWHYMKWDAVLHPIDYWVHHSRPDRRDVDAKLHDFMKGLDVVPKGFVATKIPAGEITLSGSLYLVDEMPRPLVVLLAGTFGSHLSAYLAETGRLLALSGRFHILLLASRMSVSTMRDAKVLGSGGILESRDTLAAIRWARKEAPFSELVSRVGVYGVSLSADYVVQTMALDAEGLIDSALVVSGAYNPEALARDIDEKGTGLSRFKYLWAGFFLKALRMHVGFVEQAFRLGFTEKEIQTFRLSEYGARLSFPFYAKKLAELFGKPVTYEEFSQLSCALNVVGRVRGPLLAIHSHQDDWMGFKHADELARRAAPTPAARLHYVDGAGHASYFMHDPDWFAFLLDSYYGYWLDPAPAPALHMYTGDTVRYPGPK